jgi:protein associated with RNAse G/E
VVARKWPDRPHWEHDALVLGEDDHGVWVGAPAGTRMARPGVGFTCDQAQVTLFPRDAAFVATFYAPGGSSVCDVYVDIVTVPVWSDSTVTAVDLDLDVIRGWTGRVWVDDEDEFAANRVRYAYPPDLVRLAATSCAQVHAAVAGGGPPYDNATAGRWFEALDAVEA